MFIVYGNRQHLFHHNNPLNVKARGDKHIILLYLSLTTIAYFTIFILLTCSSAISSTVCIYLARTAAVLFACALTTNRIVRNGNMDSSKMET